MRTRFLSNLVLIDELHRVYGGSGTATLSFIESQVMRLEEREHVQHVDM